jgi:hyperosmotically inducible protein
MRYARLLGCSFLAVTLVGVPGLGAAAGDAKDKVKNTAQEAKGQVSDSWLTAKTKIALFGDDRVKSTQISVETINGVVALRGKVDSADAKQAAGEIAKGIEGVKDVKNELQVVGQTERKAVETTDKEITRRVHDRLSKDARLKKIDVRTDAGVVTLTGQVPNIGVSARASELARGVAGVRSVRNDLSVDARSSSAAPATRTR